MVPQQVLAVQLLQILLSHVSIPRILLVSLQLILVSLQLLQVLVKQTLLMLEFTDPLLQKQELFLHFLLNLLLLRLGVAHFLVLLFGIVSIPLDLVLLVLDNQTNALKDIGDVVDSPLLHIQNLHCMVQVHALLWSLLQQIDELLRQLNQAILLPQSLAQHVEGLVVYPFVLVSRHMMILWCLLLIRRPCLRRPLILLWRLLILHLALLRLRRFLDLQRP